MHITNRLQIFRCVIDIYYVAVARPLREVSHLSAMRCGTAAKISQREIADDESALTVAQPRRWCQLWRLAAAPGGCLGNTCTPPAEIWASNQAFR